MNEAVTEYIQNIKQDWQISICTTLRELILEAIPEVEERLQYSKPHYLKDKKYACVIGTAKGWVSFTIFNATAFEAPDGFFEADGPPERKTIKIKKDQEVDYDLLSSFIKQAADTLA